MNKSFISQPITPEGESFGLGTMAAGEPDLASGFTWKGKSYRIIEVKERWKSSGPDRGGSKERYLRKHWFRVLVRQIEPTQSPPADTHPTQSPEAAPAATAPASGAGAGAGEQAPADTAELWEMEIYFDRQPTNRRVKERWWLFTKKPSPGTL